MNADISANISAAADPPDPVPIAAINDYLYCARRCALHRLDALWRDNAWTVAGTLAHEHADDPGYRQTAEGARIERALPLFSARLGLIGKADIVEFWPQPDGSNVPLPVDYKLGKRRKWNNDEAQLCAQALCLEDMLGVSVPKGAIYHVKTRRRREVLFSPELRALTLEAARQVHLQMLTEELPEARLAPQCDGCSVRAVCMPELACGRGPIEAAYKDLFERGCADG